MIRRRIHCLCAAITAVVVTTDPAIAEPQRLSVATYSTNINSVTFRSAPSGISFKSKKVPAWTLHVQRQHSPYIRLPARLIPGSSGNAQSIEVSAMRSLPARFPQHLFASFKASPYNANDYPGRISLSPESGMAATFGWRIGDLHRLNMALEVEHRELGQDKEITLINLDVHYYF